MKKICVGPSTFGVMAQLFKEKKEKYTWGHGPFKEKKEKYTGGTEWPTYQETILAVS